MRLLRLCLVAIVFFLSAIISVSEVSANVDIGSCSSNSCPGGWDQNYNEVRWPEIWNIKLTYQRRQDCVKRISCLCLGTCQNGTGAGCGGGGGSNTGYCTACTTTVTANECRRNEAIVACVANFLLRNTIPGQACWHKCEPIPNMQSWTGDTYAQQCNLYTCAPNYIEVGNNTGAQLTGVNGNTCKRGSRCVAPSNVAPNSEAKISCAGLKNFVTSGGGTMNSAEYLMIVRKGGTEIFQSGWKSLSSTSDELSAYNVGEEWVEFPEFSDGSYTTECKIRYGGDPEEYTSTCGFTVSPQGTSCDNLSFDPDVIPIGGTTTAKCDVSNAQGGKRRIQTEYEQGPNGWITNFFTTNTLTNYMTASGPIARSIGGMNSFSLNGTYNSFCSAVANVSHDGFQSDGFTPTYQLVTSGACGSPDPTIPVYVGESYCDSIVKPSYTYADTPFDVTCRLDTTATDTPTSYHIVSIDGSGNKTSISTGNIPAGATQITQSIALPLGTHTVGCLIIGPQNPLPIASGYVAPSCKTEIIPQQKPGGNCQPGDDISNATACPGDTDPNSIGADVPAIIVDQCTTSRKCEYVCDTATHVRSGNRCVPKAACTNLATPSHIRPGRDYPVIQCQGDSTARFFRYKISGPGVNYVSAAYPTDSSGYGEKVHESFLPESGTYEVTCHVGTDAASINTNAPVEPACKKDVTSDPNAPFCKRLDRYIVGGVINYADSLPVGSTVQYTCVAQPGSPSLGSSTDVFRIRYQTPSGPRENVGGPVFNIPPIGFPVFQGQQLSLAYGNHTTNCLLKVGSGYSTAPECGDSICSSDTGDCGEPVCEPTDTVCCGNELNGSGVCCRLDPLHSSCDVPITYPPTDMMRRVCTNTNTNEVLIGCYDDSCVDYGIENSSGLAFTSLTNPYLEHGALIFATVSLPWTSSPLPLYIRDGNGIISTRYLYWAGSDVEAPTSGGFRFYNYTTGAEINPAKWTNSDVRISIDCKDGLGRASGVDTLFCGCDIPDDHNFQVEYGSKTITRDSGTLPIQDEDNIFFTRIVSENESGSIDIRDTAGNQASGNTYTYDIDWIDKDGPEITVDTSAGPIGSVDRAVTPSADVTIRIADDTSGIVHSAVQVTNAGAFTTTINCAVGGVTRNYPATGDATRNLAQGILATDRAIFVCARDAAGNITTKKFTFGGTRIINYFQGPVMGFSYSGEIGVADRDSYEEKLIDRVESRRVAINDTYNAREGDRISCQNTAIEQNIDVLARGRLVPNPGNLNTINTLLTNTYDSNLVGSTNKNSDGIIYYSFDTTGASVDGNAGRIVELSGDIANYADWNDPIQGPYSPEGSNSFRKVGISGLKTLIVEGGNLYINADMYYENPQSMLVIIVKRGTPSIHGHGQGGNVYINKDVTNVNGLIFADGAILNVEGTSTGLDVLSSYHEEDVEKLRRQLLIYGSLASANTRGGSLKVDGSGTRIAYKISEYDDADGHCPYGTDMYRSNGSTGFENCAIEDAAKYDLETFRTFNLTFSDLPNRYNLASAPNCSGVCSCYNSNIHERVPVGGIGTTTIIPDYFNSTTYALSGKRQCYYGSSKGDARFEIINDFYATYVKFDTRDLKFEFPILSEGTCR